MRLHLLAITTTALLALSATSVRSATPIDSLSARVEHQRHIYPQEKFHVMTDQSHYMGGDTVWLRGFIVDATTHQPIAVSKYLYVELRNPFDSIAQRIKIAEREGAYSGYLPLDVNITEGEYTLTAYTNYSKSLDQNYFFKKKLDIRSPLSTVFDITPEFKTDGDNLIVTLGYTDRATGKAKEYNDMSYTTSSGKTRSFMRGNSPRRVKLSADDRAKGSVLVRYNSYSKFVTLPDDKASFHVSFHPEGGYTVNGTPCRIAFKAIDSQGRGVSVTGSIIDHNGESIATIRDTHRGMGTFVIVPQPGEKYTAVISDGQSELTFPIPDARDDAAVLHVDNSRASSLFIETAGTVPPGAVITGIQRGAMLFAAPATGKAINIDKTLFPEGIVQVLMVDADGRTLSERLIFIRHPRQKATLASHLSAYLTRTNTKMTVTLDNYRLPEGDFAVAVTDNLMTEPDSATSISSQLLLQSDLKGHIEDAGYYFRNPTRKTDSALDALMMTQGWKRYDIPQTFAGNYAVPTEKVERSQEITGTVGTLWRNKPMKDAAISVIAPKFRFADAVMSDDHGRFTIEDIDFPEGTKFLIQALNNKGKGSATLEIDRPVTPLVTAIAPQAVHITDSTPSQQPMANTRWRMMRNNGLMEIMLDEVSVTHRKSPAEMDDDEYSAMASKSFGREQLEKEHLTTYESILNKIGGLTQSNGVLCYHGKPVSFYVDGFKWTADDHAEVEDDHGNTELIATATKLSDFEMMYPMTMVKSIHFIQPNQALALGTGNSGGAIAITTLDGTEASGWTQPENLKVVTPLGYQPVAEFYSPKYELTAENDGTDLRSTIYWNPCIKVSDGKAGFDFFTSDNHNTTYTVRIEGMTYDGEIIQATGNITVK